MISGVSSRKNCPEYVFEILVPHDVNGIIGSGSKASE